MNATGQLGDQDPIQALDDALRVFEADEIVISTHPPARSNWLEKQIVRKARESYSVPVTHVVVDLVHESTHMDEDGMKRQPIVAPERRLRVFHASAYDEALAIQSSGFRDRPAPGTDGTGVWVSDRPPADAIGRRVGGLRGGRPRAGRPGLRAWHGARAGAASSPRRAAQRHGPPIAEGDWSEWRERSALADRRAVDPDRGWRDPGSPGRRGQPTGRRTLDLASPRRGPRLTRPNVE